MGNIENCVESLKKSPLYSLSMANKELFHSNFLAWFGDQYKNEFKVLMNKLLGTEVLKDNNFSIEREYKHFDICVKVNGNEIILIENKVKSVPTSEQLEGYMNEVKCKKCKFILLTMTQELQDLSKAVGWTVITYKDLSEKMPDRLNDCYHYSLLKDYRDYVNNLQDIIEIYDKEKNYNFEIKMIGNGELLEKTKSQIEKYNLTNQIKLVGAVKSDKVRSYMEKANIFICTSDKNERWGVVLNEAMNSGCAVIAYKGIGGVPFLIKNNENGLAYTSLDDFYKKTMKVMDDKALREKLSKNAYKTISEVWTAKVAVQNFEKLVKSIIDGKPNPVKEGPASTAYPVN